MAMTDPLADMLTRIRNAVQRRHATVQMPASTLKVEIARVLHQEGFLQGVERITEGGHPVLRLHLPKVRGGMGVAILTTPQGVMTGTESRVQKIGGEVLCYIW